MPKTRTRRKMGRTGIRPHRQNGRFNRRTSKVYSKRNSNSRRRREANNKAKLLERKINKLETQLIYNQNITVCLFLKS